MALIASMAGKEDTVGNNHVVFDFNEVGTHIIQVASHPDKDVLANLVAAPAVECNPEVGERDGWDEYGREPFADRFGKNGSQRVVIIVRRFRALMAFAVEPA